MKLKIKNIGKIDNAEIIIDGLTIIAGKNDTGKSTISKSLYSIFNSMSNYEYSIIREKIIYIRNMFRREIQGSLEYHRKARSLFYRMSEDNRFYAELNLILDNENSDDTDTTVNKIKDLFSQLIDEENFEYSDEFTKEIAEVVTLSHDVITKQLFTNNFSSEFNNQINNVFSKKTGEISLKIKEKTSSVVFLNDTVKEFNNIYTLDLRAVYLDDPHILETYNPISRNEFDHRSNLKKLLYDDSRFSIESENVLGDNNVIQQIETNKKLININNKLSDITKGKLVEKTPRSLGFVPDGEEDELSISNLSSGLKTFIIIQRLLKSNKLQENGTLIMDEPEIHLHPEWQIILAEIIVMIQKEFNMHILLATHSPYFLNAIEVFSDKYELNETTNFYLSSKNEKGTVNFQNVNSTEKIYALLAEPFQTLEDLEYDE